MKNTEFKKLLFKSAFCAMACDGEIHETEIAELKEMINNSLYFDGLDFETEFKVAHSELKNNGNKIIQALFSEVETSDILEKQKNQMIEVLIRMIKADNKIDENELVYMQSMKKSLKLTDENLIIKFPKHLDLLVNLETYSEKPLKDGLETLDFSAVKDFTF